MPADRKKKRRRRSPAFRRAARDVRIAQRPFRRELRQAKREGLRDIRDATRRTNQAYSGLRNEIAPLSGQYADQMSTISQGFTDQLGSLADLLGSSVPGVPAGEISAGTGAFGAIGAGGLSELASQSARNVAYNTSAMRQGGLERGMARRNFAQDRLDFLKDIRGERLDLAREAPALIRQRMDELRDRGFDRSMALREYQLRARAAGLDERLARSDLRGQQAWADLLMGLTPEELVRLGLVRLGIG